MKLTLASVFIIITEVTTLLLQCGSAYGQQVAVDSTATPSPAAHHATTSNLSLILNVNMSSDSREGNEVMSADWLSSVSAKVFMDGEPDQFAGRIDATYGQHVSELEPQKTQDDLIVSFTPSRTIVPVIGLRLFLEVTGETQFTEGHVDTTATNFLDPLFLYQSLFVGKRLSSVSEDGITQFNLTAGVGYALQQTMANSFILQQNRNIVVTANNPLNQSGVTIESGYSAIVDLNYMKMTQSCLMFTLGAKTVALSKDDLKGDLTKSRVTSLFSVVLQYKIVNINYQGHLTYDANVSLRRELSQFLGFGLKLDI
jgi:hypothetical protein